MRVVSLLPSATEIVFALGHGSELVGRSVDCDFPDAALALPVVMHPRGLGQRRPFDRHRRTGPADTLPGREPLRARRGLTPTASAGPAVDPGPVRSMLGHREGSQGGLPTGGRPPGGRLAHAEDLGGCLAVGRGRRPGPRRPGGRCSALENPPIPIGTAAVLGTTPRGSGRMAGSPHLGGPLDPRHRGGRGRSARGS